MALPDTQYYSGEKQPIFQSQTQWIADHQKELNIACVVHEGDITDKNSEPQWQGAVQAMSVLDGIVPVMVVPGNHDTGGGRRPCETCPGSTSTSPPRRPRSTRGTAGTWARATRTAT